MSSSNGTRPIRTSGIPRSAEVLEHSLLQKGVRPSMARTAASVVEGIRAELEPLGEALDKLAPRLDALQEASRGWHR